MSSTKRSSTLPKPPTVLSPSVTISDTALLTGTHPITIHENTVVHPRVTLFSVHAPLTIGNTCIISDRAQIGLQAISADQSAEGVVLEDAVIVEVNAVVEAKSIGMGSVIETGAVVGKGAVIGKFCKIGALCRVAENEIIPDYTVLFGENRRRTDTSDIDDLKLKLVSRQAEVLRKLVSGNLAKWQ